MSEQRKYERGGSAAPSELPAPVGRDCVSCRRRFHPGLCSGPGNFCAECAGSGFLSALEQAAMTTKSKDPVRITEMLMEHPKLEMLSCDHAYPVAAGFLAALVNSPYRGRLSRASIKEAIERVRMAAVPEGCSRTGVCTIVHAVGACCSLFLDVRFGLGREQRMIMDATAAAARAMADLAGPVCCKANARTALLVVTRFFFERFGVMLPASASSIICNVPEKHPFGCREDRCPYYRKEKVPGAMNETPWRLPVCS